MKRISLCSCLALSAAFLLCAQEAQPGNRATKGRVAWFVSTSLPEEMENPITVMAGGDLMEVSLSKRSPSEAVRIPQDGVFSVVRKTEEAAGPGKPPYLTLAKATVPPGVSKALVILIPASEPGASDPKITTKVQDLANFKGGDWLFLNLTKVDVGVDMGKSNMVMKPGQIRIYDSASSAGSELMPIRYRYLHPVEEQWNLLSASTVGIVPTRREICIFSIDPRYERIEYHGISFPVSN